MTCATCGQENPAGFSFCGKCGAALAAEAATDVRKTVTVVFCDLVGSTALGDQADPEVLREQMTRYHAELRAILERHGGTVEKFVGDAAMAVFGMPQVHEDDALRAVRAALEMRDAVAALGLEVRIGVNTGEVVAGAGETLATGDAVNVAARLEQAASAGEILIGAATRAPRRATRSGRTRSSRSCSRASASRSWRFRVLELVDDAPAFTRAIDRPFVGRGVELAPARERARDAQPRRGVPQLGDDRRPSGHRKVAPCARARWRTDARVLVGRCLPYGEGITYWPLAGDRVARSATFALRSATRATPSSPRSGSRPRSA